MTNIPPRDPVPPRDPRPANAKPAHAKVNRRSHIAIGVVAGIAIITAILWFSAASQHPDNPAQGGTPVEVDPSAGQGQDTSGTAPAPTEPTTEPAAAPTGSNSGTTNQ